jgi:hypothetical protein
VRRRRAAADQAAKDDHGSVASSTRRRVSGWWGLAVLCFVGGGLWMLSGAWWMLPQGCCKLSVHAPRSAGCCIVWLLHLTSYEPLVC